jgi:hypothetical protein
MVTDSEIKNILDNPTTYYITVVHLSGNLENIENFANKFSGSEVKIIETSANENEEIISNKTNDDEWLPSEGYITCTDVPDEPEERYVFNSFKWNYFPAFEAEDTYEHDFFLNSYNDGEYPDTYLSEAATILGRPAATYAVSTLPIPYLDTRLDDAPDAETAYTLGCAKAISIHNDKLYYNYIQIDNGSDDIDHFKLQGQLGHRVPLGCISTFCSFSTEITTIVPAWQNIPTLAYYWNLE